MINKIKFLIISVVFLPEIIFAADCGSELNPLKICSVKQLIGGILAGMTYILTPIIVLALIYSGFLFVSAQGDSNKLGTAKTAFTYSLVGAALILGANMIFSVVYSTIKTTIGA